MRDGVFRFALDYALEMVLLFGKDGKITYANHAAKQLLEYGDDLIGRGMGEIFPGEFRNDNGTFIDWESAIGRMKDAMAYRKNQTCFPVQLQFGRMEEEPFLYFCMGINTTDRELLSQKVQQADAKVETAQKIKNEFVANITHELRTPVNGILANTKELMDDEGDESRLQKLQLIERGCKDMNALINNILDFSKLEAGKFTLEQRKFNFRAMMDYVKANHRSKTTEKGLDFFMTISPEIPENIVADELRIVQILNNLLSNACKFTSVGKITVEALKTAQSGNKIELFFLVLDTGIGIDKEGQDKLFKSFSQVDASISRKYGGTGLGLNITKQLIEMMGGKIYVQSELGKGTMFSFYIWVELPEEEMETVKRDLGKPAWKPIGLEEALGEEHLREFGSRENRAELKKKMSKLILSLEMENWEKAEMFMESIKQLTDFAPQEIKNMVLRLKMAVQKGDYTKSTAAYEILEKELGYGNE